jgi:PAS domain S-box-containing protein
LPSLSSLTVFDHSRDAIVAFAEDGICLYANEAALQLYRAPDLVGRRMGELRTRRSAAVETAQWSRLRRDGNLADELEIKLPEGGHTRLGLRAVSDYLPGVHLAVVRPVDGAEEQRRSPALTRLRAPGALFRAAFEDSPHASVIADGERRLVLANRAARRILGVGIEELTRRRLDDFAPPEARSDLDRMWAIFLERGTLQGVSSLVVAHDLRRTVQFTAKAGIVPDRHMSVFSVAAPQRDQSGVVIHDGPQAEPLSPREREVLTLLARGSSAEAIADHAEVSPDTVRTHLRNAMKKLGAHTRTHAVARAIRRREIDP